MAATEEPASTVEPAVGASAAEKPLKGVAKPDEGLLKEKIAAEDEKIAVRQARLQAIKESLDSRDTGRSDNSELNQAKAKYNDARSESRRLVQEKRNIYDQISAADELKKQQQDLTQRLRSELSFFSVEDIERKIKVLEMSQQTTSLSIKEDKKLMEEIKRLSSNKPLIKQYDEAQESLKGVKEHHNNLYTQLKAKSSELSGVKEIEEKCKGEMDEARSKEEAKRSDIPGLFKERETLRKEINEFREEVRRIRDEFNEQRKEWFAYQKQIRDQRNKEYAERKAAKQKEWDEQRKAYEEEEAKRDPWEEEKNICETLISFVGGFLPKEKEEEKAKVATEIPSGAKMMKGKKGDDDDEGNPYAAIVKKKSKRKGGGAPAAEAPKSVKLSMSPADFAIFEKLGFTAPATTGECPALYAKLLEKREWLKTAPPKEKKKPPPPKKEEPKDKDQSKEKEQRGGLHKFDEEEVDVYGGDATADDLMDAFGFGDDAPAEAAPAADAPASEKEKRGGLHKFDEEEVDVYGGDATADDLMDAFGFGGDDGGDAPAEAS